MQTSIIRSPLMGGTRIQLSQVTPTPAGAVAQPGHERLELERKLRAELQAEFDRKLEALKAKAYEEAMAKGLEEGRAKGHQEGHQAGKKDWEGRLDRLDERLDQTAQSLKAFWEETADAAEELGFAALCRLIGERALSRDVIAGMVEQMTRQLCTGDILRLRLHPSEYGELKKAIEEGEPERRLRLARLVDRLTPDPSLESGGCIVETTRGEYVGTLEVQLSRLRTALKARRHELDRSRATPDGAIRA